LTKPPISVVLCTYNGAKYIEAQLASIIAQTYAVAEIIVVDDVSTDDTMAVVERAAARDSRISLSQNRFNIGFTSNFESALQIAKHDYIAISDQDDIWHLQKIEKMMAAFTSDAAAIYCDSVRFTKDIPIHPIKNKSSRHVAGTDVRKLAMYNTVSGHALIIRKSLLEKALPIPSAVYYDWWLALQAVTSGGLQYLDEILVYQRAHDNNVTIAKNASSKELRNSYRTMLRTHLQAFVQIASLSEKDKIFFIDFAKHWSQMLKNGTSSGLFLFMLKNRKDLFYYKKRRLPLLAAIKHSFLFAFRRR
jgi:glycosyltransferase involved in cell wall biosynthesis